MKKLTIINRLSCRAKKITYAEAVISKIKKEVASDIVFTEYRGHAEKIARDSCQYDLIIAGGGDGTISEIVNGMDLENQALAVLPFGTGNSLAHDLRIKTPARAFDAIKRCRKGKIDLLRCKLESGKGGFFRYVVTTSGIGFAAASVSFGKKYLKKTGPLCYILSACFKSVRQEVISATINIDDSPPEEIKFTNCFINNTMHAGNACVFPRADLADSMLNLLFAKTNFFLQYMWNIGIITKTYFYYPGEKAANKLQITLNRPFPFMLDGEIFNSVKEITYSLIPRALSVLT